MLAVNERGGIVLDRTVFYAAAGGQPGDKGALEVEGGGTCPIATTVYDADKTTIVHVPAEGSAASRARPDACAPRSTGTRAHRLMRMHTALHLLCALVKFPVTGGQVGADESRLDFDIEDAAAVDKDKLTADLNALIAADHPVSERWITDAELEANPGLVRTMAVKPPMGTGRVRLVVIGEGGAVDLQPCGGTHVQAHRRDRPRRRHQDREEGQAQPAHPRRVRLSVAERNSTGRKRMADDRSKWLVETDWLAAHLDAPGPRRPRRLHAPAHRQARRQGRVPGRAHPRRAVLRHRRHRRREVARCRTCCRRPAKFASRMKKMGIGDGMRVVVYDSEGLYSAARVWWMFRAMGHEDVRVLNGGLKKWKAEGRAARGRRAARGAPSATSPPRSTPSWCATSPT